MKEPLVEQLINLFNQLFLDSYNTVLVLGDEEPVYLPADSEHAHHRIVFAHGFYASALHEISHWCVAGSERRKLEDFGYWYNPDGRTAEEQIEFEKVEIRPQAFEWILSVAAGHRFHFSADNLSSGIGASDEFKKNVLNQVYQLLEDRLPERVERLVQGLIQQSGRGPLKPSEFYL